MCVLCYCWWPHVCLLQESVQLITAHSGVPLLNDVMNNEYGDTHHIEAPEGSDININNKHYNTVKVQTCTVCVFSMPHKDGVCGIYLPYYTSVSGFVQSCIHFQMLIHSSDPSRHKLLCGRGIPHSYYW